MRDVQSGPQKGETRFADDGTLEVYNGEAWEPYQPPDDHGPHMILRRRGEGRRSWGA